MRKNEVENAIHEIIQNAVLISGGEWKRSYRPQVDKIFEVMGKLSPEPGSGNIKPPPPVYNKSQVRKVGKPKTKFTPQEFNGARAILRKIGMI